MKWHCTVERCVRYPAQCVFETLEHTHVVNDKENELVDDVVENVAEDIPEEETTRDDEKDNDEDAHHTSDDQSDDSYDMDTVHSDDIDVTEHDGENSDDENNDTDDDGDDEDDDGDDEGKNMKTETASESYKQNDVHDDSTTDEIADKIENSALLVDFTNTPMESPVIESKCEQVTDSEHFTPKKITADVEHSEMDTNEKDGTANNIQIQPHKRKSRDKSQEDAKRVKEKKKNRQRRKTLKNVMIIKFLLETMIAYLFLFTMLNIYSLNANGLRNVEKMRDVFITCDIYKWDILCIQETFWSDDFICEVLKIW